MSTSVSHVESPKADATSGQLDGLQQQALASAQTAQIQISQVEEAQSKAAGAEVEAKREEAGASYGNAESDLLINGLAQSVGGSAELITAASDIITERTSDPAKQIDTDSVSEKMSGIMAGGKTTSFEQMFTKMKGGPSIIERSEIAALSVGGQNETSVPGAIAKETTSAMQQVKEVAMTCGIANEKVLGQIQAVRATPQGPNLGGQAPGMNHNLASGPKFKEPKDEAVSSTDEAWV